MLRLEDVVEKVLENGCLFASNSLYLQHTLREDVLS